MTKIRILGVDPGTSGGLAVLERTEAPVGGTYRVLEIQRMPKVAGKFDSQSTAKLIASMWAQHTFHFAALERPQVFGAKGTQGALSQGRSFGVVEGILHSLGLQQVYIVSPTSWHAAFLRGMDAKLETKQKSFARVLELFPGLNLVPPRCQVPHDGIAESILLAMFGFRLALQQDIPKQIARPRKKVTP